MRTRINLTAALAVLITSLVLAGTASARTITETASAPLASGGTVTASLSYTPNPKLSDDTDLTLTITRAGQQLVGGPLASKTCAEYCVVSQGDESKAIHVVDLLGNGEPVVFADFFTGGAHCCSVTDFYTYSAATQAYSLYERNWGDPGYDLKQLGGRYIFDTDNDAFANEFTAYAASGMPLQLFSFTGSTMADVTRQHAGLISQDAARWLKLYTSLGAPAYKWAGSTGIIAPWAADEDELGRSAIVAKYLTAQAAAGHLLSGGGYPNGTRFITRLNAFLKHHGYLK